MMENIDKENSDEMSISEDFFVQIMNQGQMKKIVFVR